MPVIGSHWQGRWNEKQLCLIIVLLAPQFPGFQQERCHTDFVLDLDQNLGQSSVAWIEHDPCHTFGCVEQQQR
jgi:hypothetical protein